MPCNFCTITQPANTTHEITLTVERAHGEKLLLFVCFLFCFVVCMVHTSHCFQRFVLCHMLCRHYSARKPPKPATFLFLVLVNFSPFIYVPTNGGKRKIQVFVFRSRSSQMLKAGHQNSQIHLRRSRSTKSYLFSLSELKGHSHEENQKRARQKDRRKI